MRWKVVLVSVLAAAALIFAAWGFNWHLLPLPVSGPCLPEGCDYRERIKSAMGQFQDAMEVANASPRIALGARVERLQQVKRELEAAPAPPCAEHARARMLGAMSLSINSYLAFMTANDERLQDLLAVQEARTRASDAWTAAAIALADASGRPTPQPPKNP